MSKLLSPHFTLEELTITHVRGVDNTPPASAVENLKVLAQMLEKVRVLLAHPVIISSGYRSFEVNARVGGTSGSAHCMGYAADFICPGFGSPLDICNAISGAQGVRFDQLIEEGAWVHLSVAPAMRGQVLTKTPTGYETGIRRAMV